ncbi:MAG TPA: glycosyltransferase [bacterium]|nr:glycosyltransferase [bacterium]
MMKALSVIVVSYNVKAFLEKALVSIEEAVKTIDSEIWVVDNASTDGSPAMVRKRFPHVKLLVNKDNVGFARANNQVLKQCSGRKICLVNPDTLIRKDTFRVCMECLDQHEQAGAVGCKIVNPDGSFQLSCRRGFPDPWSSFAKVTGLSRLFPKSRFFSGYNLTYYHPDTMTEVDSLSGSFMMVRREVIEGAGFLDERFFLYGEDLDWCCRIRQKGWKILYCPETQIIHYKGQSASAAPFDSLWYFYKAMRLFVKKHHHSRWAIPRWLLDLGIFFRAFLSFGGKWLHRWGALIADAVLLQAGLVLSIWIRFGDLWYWPHYMPINAAYTLVWLLSLFFMGVYTGRNGSAGSVVTAVFIGWLFNTSITFFLPGAAFSRQVILLAGAVDACMLGGWRWLKQKQISRLKGAGISCLPGAGKQRVLFIGWDDNVEQWLNGVGKRKEKMTILGRVTTGSPAGTHDAPIPVLGHIDDLERIISVHKVQKLILAPRAVSGLWLHSVLGLAHRLNVSVRLIPSENERWMGLPAAESRPEAPLRVLNTRFSSEFHVAAKRLMDILIALCTLPAVLIRMSVVLFDRNCCLFSSEIADGFGHCVRVFIIKRNDQKSVRWPRAPWVLSILKGELSWVGSLVEPCCKALPGRGYKPGWTGPNQQRNSETLSPSDQEKNDWHYLQNHSILIDVQLLIRCIIRRIAG